MEVERNVIVLFQTIKQIIYHREVIKPFKFVMVAWTPVFFIFRPDYISLIILVEKESSTQKNKYFFRKTAFSWRICSTYKLSIGYWGEFLGNTPICGALVLSLLYRKKINPLASLLLTMTFLLVCSDAIKNIESGNRFCNLRNTEGISKTARF